TLQDFLPKVQQPGVAQFIRYLLSIHPADRLPARQHFDPLAIPGLLSGIALVTVERETDRVRLRMKVVGQDLVDAAPVKLAHRYIDDVVLDLPGSDIILHSRLQVVETGCAYLRKGEPSMPFTYRMAALEYVHCPLADDGETVDHILSFFSYKRVARGGAF
ncbi:MAG: hypothetical protein ACK4Z4_13135, partial [Ferrovibrio sp.]